VGPIRPPPGECAGGRGGDRLPGPRVLVPRARVRRTSSALPVLARRAGLHAGLRLPTPDAAISAVAETPAGRGRGALGAEVTCPPWISGRIAGPVRRSAHRAHAPRPPRHDRLGGQ